MELVSDRKEAQSQSQDMRENLQTMESGRYPLERKEIRPTRIFDGGEKSRLEAFITRDARTRRLGWEAIALAMGYTCSARLTRSPTSKLFWSQHCFLLSIDAPARTDGQLFKETMLQDTKSAPTSTKGMDILE